MIARKISKSVGILFKLSKYLPLEIIKTLYYSLINPFLLYGIEIWHGTNANITNKIFILQKKACHLPFNTHTTEYFKNSTKILKLTDLHESQISTQVFKCLNLLSLLLLLKEVGSARLRESGIPPISPKTPAPQYQPIDRKKRKGKKVADYSRDRAA